MTIDQIVIIPGPAGQGIQLAPASTSSVPQIAGRQATQVNSATQQTLRTHVVHKGDTLESIARQYGTSTSALRALNNLKTDTVRVGVKLRIPGTGNRS